MISTGEWDRMEKGTPSIIQKKTLPYPPIVYEVYGFRWCKSNQLNLR